MMRAHVRTRASRENAPSTTFVHHDVRWCVPVQVVKIARTKQTARIAAGGQTSGAGVPKMATIKRTRQAPTKESAQRKAQKTGGDANERVDIKTLRTQAATKHTLAATVEWSIQLGNPFKLCIHVVADKEEDDEDVANESGEDVEDVVEDEEEEDIESSQLVVVDEQEKDYFVLGSLLTTSECTSDSLVQHLVTTNTKQNTILLWIRVNPKVTESGVFQRVTDSWLKDGKKFDPELQIIQVLSYVQLILCENHSQNVLTKCTLRESSRQLTQF